ncbi:Uncharacterised protein [Bordetella pertussis]|nr:Uncharacterised protein [Bordetella pertussis]
MPAARALIPPASISCRVSAVTVVLPLVPVIASTRGRYSRDSARPASARANSSISPTTSTLRSRACSSSSRVGDSCGTNPGLSTICATPSSRSGGNCSPQPSRYSTVASASAACSAASPPGCARESVTRRGEPWRAYQRAAATPVSPNPRIRTSGAAAREVSVVFIATSVWKGRPAPASW